MKKLLVLVCVLAMAAASLTGCGGKENGTETTAGAEAAVDMTGVTLINEGVLTVGAEIGYPPFEDYAEDGTTPIGFDVDIATEVARRMGLEVNFINTAWDGIFEGIDVNYDCVCSAVAIDAKRKEAVLFSTPYINNYQAIVVPAGSELVINSFTDLDGMTIAVQKETTSDLLLSDYKSTGTIDIEIVANEKVTSCFTQLTNGEVDVVAVDSTVADGYVAKSPEKYTIIFEDTEEPEQFAIAMGLENSPLQAAINEALAQMEEDGFIQEAYDYWFGSAEAVQE